MGNEQSKTIAIVILVLLILITSIVFLRSNFYNYSEELNQTAYIQGYTEGYIQGQENLVMDQSQTGMIYYYTNETNIAKSSLESLCGR